MKKALPLRTAIDTLRSVVRIEPIETDQVKRRLARAASPAGACAEATSITSTEARRTRHEIHPESAIRQSRRPPERVAGV
jgi:hypothetical protein